MYLPAYDIDARTKERRELILKTAIKERLTNVLMLHHPHPEGKKFVREFKATSGSNVTIVDRRHISKNQRESYGADVKIMDHTDLTIAMGMDRFDGIDADFCGGMMKRYVEALESNRDWRILFLKISNVFRSKTDKPAIPKGVHVQTWIFEWCKANGWTCSLNPIPYPRGEKGLWFYSFVIRRTT